MEYLYTMNLQENIDRIKQVMGLNLITENKEQFQDRALDKINQVGGIDNLTDIDKLALLGGTNDPRLKTLNLINIFRENGGTFGKMEIKVRVKDLKDQAIDHNFSKDTAGQEGYLNGYIHYDSDDKTPLPYVSVRFDEFTEDDTLYGGGRYKDLPIMLDNIYPIDYDEIKSEFVKYDQRRDQERADFKSKWDNILGDEPEEI